MMIKKLVLCVLLLLFLGNSVLGFISTATTVQAAPLTGFTLVATPQDNSDECGLTNVQACFSFLAPDKIFAAVMSGLGDYIMGLIKDIRTYIKDILSTIINDLLKGSGSTMAREVKSSDTYQYSYGPKGGQTPRLTDHLTTKEVAQPVCPGDKGKDLDGIGNLISCVTVFGTSPGLTYKLQAVKDYQTLLKAIAMILMAGVILIGGLSTIVKESLSLRWYVKEIIPRILMAACWIQAAPLVCSWIIEFNNQLIIAFWNLFIAENWHSFPDALTGDPHFNLPTVLLFLTSMGLVILTCILFVQAISRLAIINIMLIIAPLGVLAWVLPQTQGFYRWWLRGFISALFVQAVQALCVMVGLSFTFQLYSAGSDVFSLIGVYIVGISVIWTSIKIPQMLNSLIANGSMSSAASTIVSAATGAVALISGAGIGAIALGALTSAASKVSGAAKND